MLRNGFALIIMVLLVISLSSCGGNNNNNNTAPSTPNSPAASEPAANVHAEAENIYRQNCITCHAADLSGYNLNNVGSRLSLEQIYNQIANGGNGMPAFKNSLNEDQIHALSEWLAAQT